MLRERQLAKVYVNLNIQDVPKVKLKILRDDSFYYSMKNEKKIVINVGKFYEINYRPLLHLLVLSITARVSNFKVV